MALNREQLLQKLRQLNSTQQSIESTANWCLFYGVREAKTLVSVWDEEFTRLPSAEKKLTQLYLCNHILQVLMNLGWASGSAGKPCGGLLENFA